MLIILLRPFSMNGGLCTSSCPRFLRSVDTAEDANVRLFGTMHLFTILSPKLKMVRAFSTEQTRVALSPT